MHLLQELATALVLAVRPSFQSDQRVRTGVSRRSWQWSADAGSRGNSEQSGGRGGVRDGLSSVEHDDRITALRPGSCTGPFDEDAHRHARLTQH